MATRSAAAAEELDSTTLLSALRAFERGDFSTRLPLNWVGMAGKIADAFNDIVETNDRLAAELARISRQVGRDGRINQRSQLAGVTGAWADSISSVNSLIDDLVYPTRETARVIGAVLNDPTGEAASYGESYLSYYDSPTRQLCYVNAGHCPALLAGERDGRIEVTRLPATGTVLGLLPGATYQQAACDVRPGDVLVLYSDGVVEAATSADEEYGESRLREALVAAGSAGPEDVRDGILASVGAFIGATALRDDLTLVVAKLA